MIQFSLGHSKRPVVVFVVRWECLLKCHNVKGRNDLLRVPYTDSDPTVVRHGAFEPEDNYNWIRNCLEADKCSLKKKLFPFRESTLFQSLSLSPDVLLSLNCTELLQFYFRNFFLSHHTHCSHRPLLHAVSLPLIDVVVIRRWGDAPALRVHPAVHVVGDVPSRDAAHRAHGHGQLLASLQHLRQDEKVKMWLLWRRQNIRPSNSSAFIVSRNVSLKPNNGFIFCEV